MTDDIRWKQRFENFQKALSLLEGVLLLENPDIYQKAGMVQFFEMSFELSWKLLKDFLEEEGFSDVKSPRAAIKKAFEVGIIEDGHLWLNLLEKRNLTLLTYDETVAHEIEQLIREIYFPAVTKLNEKIMGICCE